MQAEIYKLNMIEAQLNQSEDSEQSEGNDMSKINNMLLQNIQNELKKKIESMEKKLQEERKSHTHQSSSTFGVSKSFLAKIVDQSVANNCLKIVVLILQAFNRAAQSGELLNSKAFIDPVVQKDQRFVKLMIKYAQDLDLKIQGLEPMKEEGVNFQVKLSASTQVGKSGG